MIQGFLRLLGSPSDQNSVEAESHEMNEKSPHVMVLCDLAEGLPAITPAFGACLAQAAAVCLEERSHPHGVPMTVLGDHSGVVEIYPPAVTCQMRRCYRDDQVVTEHGAYGIAFLLIRCFTEYTVIERSRKGNGFDYWLGKEAGALPFQKGMARLEVSGIRQGGQKDLSDRIREKFKQTRVSDGLSIPVYVIVVEFSRPCSAVIKR